MERSSQMQGGFIDGQTVSRRPQVQGVAVRTALGITAAEHMLTQVHHKATATLVRRAMERTGSSSLGPATTQAIQIPQTGEDLLNPDLLTEVGVVDRPAGGKKMMGKNISIFRREIRHKERRNTALRISGQTLIDPVKL